jgi:transposase
MKDARKTNNCGNCKRLQSDLEAVQAQLRALQDSVSLLQQQLAAARKDSSSSSKPPSSDIVKPPKSQASLEEDKRLPGGQLGHPKHQRVLLPADQLSQPPFDYRLSHCPYCGAALESSTAEFHAVQQIELLEEFATIEEHRSHPGWCSHCERTRYAPLPIWVQRGGLAGSRLTTLIAYLKGPCHASYATIRGFLKEVAEVAISRGELAKIIKKVSLALDGPYKELLKDLPNQLRLNLDETGHKQNGARMWTWCFRAGLYTLFKIDPTRSGDVLINVLGEEFKGVLGCDYYSAYRRYMREFGVLLQFCLAHLIRDVKYLTTLPDAHNQAYGEKLREGLRRLFGVIHAREKLSAANFQRDLEAARVELTRVAINEAPGTRPAQAMAKRFIKHGEAYFRFITTPGVEPTNNLVEQAIRFVVIDRHITQGTRSASGSRWCERIWTVIATCSQQDRSVFEYLQAAVEAYFHEEEAPTLLPSSNTGEKEETEHTS